MCMVCVCVSSENTSDYFKDVGGIWEEVEEGHDHKVAVAHASLAGRPGRICRTVESLTHWDPPESSVQGPPLGKGRGRERPGGEGN